MDPISNLKTQIIDTIDDINDKQSLEKILNCALREHKDNDALAHREFFDSIWRLYPLKQAKSRVKMTRIRYLHRKGYEHCKRAIQRYIKQTDDTGYRQYQQGATFFNTGINDFWDDTFEEPPKKRYYYKV